MSLIVKAGQIQDSAWRYRSCLWRFRDFEIALCCKRRKLYISLAHNWMASFHAYLSNRISTPEEKFVKFVAWNRVSNLIACGQENGAITIHKVSQNPDHPGLCRFDIVQTLVDHKHEITAMTWNERFNKLVSGDSDGLLVVWLEYAGKWRPTMINSLSKVPVASICCSSQGDLIVIAYADGKIICGDINGNPKWESTIHYQSEIVCWSPTAKLLFVGTRDCTVLMMKGRGRTVTEMDLGVIGVKQEENKIVAMKWSRAEPAMFMIAFQSGRVALMNSENDVEPVFVDVGFTITDVAWSHAGDMIAVAGVVDAGRCQLRFYSTNGKALRTMNVNAQNITSLAFNQTDNQLVMGVDHSMFLVQMVPINPWAYLSDTLVYAFKRDAGNDFDVVFFDSKTAEKHIKRISNLAGIAASSTSVVLASGVKGVAETTLVLCNKTGIPSGTTFVPIEPDLLTVTSKYVVACSGDKLAVWVIDSDDVKFSRLKNKATAIEARDSTLFVAFASCELVIYNLPTCEETARYNLYNPIESIAVSIDLTRLSFIDIYGSMTFLDVHSGTVAGQSRKETWCMKWADDAPGLFVSLERQKLYIYREFEAEEPIVSMTHICSFHDLVITAVDFVSLYRDPLTPKLEYFHRYESKSLRDMKMLLSSEGVSQDEILNYVKEKSHQRLWLMNAEACLAAMNFQGAERCFIECQYNPGIVFMRKLNSLPKGDVKRGYVYWYLKRYEEAERCFAGTDHAVQMYATVGNWKRAAELVSEKDHEMFVRCHTALATEAFAAGDWKTAAKEYSIAGDTKRQLRALDKAEDFEGVVALMHQLPSKDPLLKDIGLKFVGIGSHEKAVEAFVKLGDVNLAIDACCHLNQWNEALRLANDHKEIDRKQLMGRYAHYLAGNSHIAAAINMFVKFGLPQEAALLLEKEGNIAFKHTRKYVFAKKCFVFAANLMTEYGKTDKSGAEKAAALWHKAEAVHFLLLAHKQLYSNEWELAIETATRVYTVYANDVGKELAAALLAICGMQSHFLKQCSNGFIQLENSANLSKKRKEKISQIAVRIFGKHSPNDPTDLEPVKCRKCKATMTPPTCKCQCGYVATPCIVTGRSIFGGQAWRCPHCRHYAIASEVVDLQVCPLCHSPKDV